MTCNINTLGPGTAKEYTVQWWFKKFCNRDKRLEERSMVAGHRKLTTTNWEQSLKLILFKLHEKFPKNSVSTILQSFNIWSKSEWWKDLVGRSELTENQKNHHFEVLSSFIQCNDNEPFLDQIMICDKKNGFYMTTSNDQLSGWIEKKLQSTSQSQTGTKKKVMVTVWWFAASLIHYSFLNPRETITYEKYAQPINKMPQKLQCLQPALVNRKGPVLLHDDTWKQIAQPTFQTLNELGYEVLPLPSYSPDLLPTDYHFFKHLDNFLQRKCLYNQ